ncbi:MAG: hypothetical protein ABI791_07470 [Acidobacteriota bacterium]
MVLGLIGFACGSSGSNGNSSSGAQNGDSPTNSYKQLYTAVKAKNLDAIKQQMSKNTLAFAEAVSQQQKTPIEKVFENGFTATTFSDKLPEIRDERIDGTNGAVEVWNSKESRWEDLPYVKEDAGWKLAVGDLFKGTWKSPGKGRATREMEAANAINGGSQMVPMPNSNTASNSNVVQKIVPKPEANNSK